MKKFLFPLLLMAALQSQAQTVIQNLQQSYQKFISNPNLKHASVSLHVVNTNTRTPVFSQNPQLGLASASTLKIVTSATAYALLGENYQYTTTLAYTGNIDNGVLNGDIIIKGGGDPTLGSWRWAATKEEAVLNELLNGLKAAGITQLNGRVVPDETSWEDEITPDGWSWQDIGNYYGAGARALNWRENQYDLLLKSGPVVGSRVDIAGTVPPFVYDLQLKSRALAGAKGSGDNAYIYHALLEPTGFVRGTIPAGEGAFKISGAMPNAAMQLATTLEARLKDMAPGDIAASPVETLSKGRVIYTHRSPELSKISYWFLNKSINLYGESLLKGMAFEKGQNGNTDAGIQLVKDFWKTQGIDPGALNMMDGSGLSPGNRITTESLVKVLQYSQKQAWFNSYFEGFPVINGIKMKSGSIQGVLGYTGIVKNKKGEEFAFAFLVNNYAGSGGTMRRNMWQVLDALK